MPHRLAITNTTLLTMDERLGDLVGADLVVEDGVITAVGAGVAPADAEEVLDGTGRIVVPGFVDSHRHMWLAVLRGRGADQTLPEYFADVLGHCGSLLTPEDVGVGTALSALTALDAGITTVQDVANINDRPGRTEAAVAALRESGLRAVFAFGHSAMGEDRPDHGGLSEAGVRRLAELLPDRGARVRMGLCVDAFTPEAARWNWALAGELDVPVVLHCLGGRGGLEPSDLRDLGVFGPRAVFVHGTGLDAAELAVLAESGAALSVAPVVEMLMGHGTPPLAAALEAGLRPTLGTDVESTGPGDMFSQMRSGLQSARHTALHGPGAPGRDEPPPRLMTSRQALEAATINGARALGMADEIGSLTPGKQADLVVLRADRPGIAPVHDPVGAVVQSADRGDVETVLVAGRAVKRDGRLLRDPTDLLARAGRVRDRLSR
ncbi:MULTISPECIES: amidohydrolase family protein [Actinosynnema]|uniref:amidohydrolase family protein n=1 Tax=Actinosynnema TaxID=40566 RepID=UPI0020A34071|nr:amidohydrolase family protein [Actinosynnema pretiosum]MCP2098511.1 Cytosine/adenosine deaminase [Actinosynnema pretiosum]